MAMLSREDALRALVRDPYAKCKVGDCRCNDCRQKLGIRVLEHELQSLHPRALVEPQSVIERRAWASLNVHFAPQADLCDALAKFKRATGSGPAAQGSTVESELQRHTRHYAEMFTFFMKKCTRGDCPRDYTCSDAHGDELPRRQLFRIPDRANGLVSWNYSNTYCRHRRIGCQRGDACKFAHTSHEHNFHPFSYKRHFDNFQSARTPTPKTDSALCRDPSPFARFPDDQRLWGTKHTSAPPPTPNSSTDPQSQSLPISKLRELCISGAAPSQSPQSPLDASSPFSASATMPWAAGAAASIVAQQPVSGSSFETLRTRYLDPGMLSLEARLLGGHRIILEYEIEKGVAGTIELSSRCWCILPFGAHSARLRLLLDDSEADIWNQPIADLRKEWRCTISNQHNNDLQHVSLQQQQNALHGIARSLQTNADLDLRSPLLRVNPGFNFCVLQHDRFGGRVFNIVVGLQHARIVGVLAAPMLEPCRNHLNLLACTETEDAARRVCEDPSAAAALLRACLAFHAHPHLCEWILAHSTRIPLHVAQVLSMYAQLPAVLVSASSLSLSTPRAAGRVAHPTQGHSDLAEEEENGVPASAVAPSVRFNVPPSDDSAETLVDLIDTGFAESMSQRAQQRCRQLAYEVRLDDAVWHEDAEALLLIFTGSTNLQVCDDAVVWDRLRCASRELLQQLEQRSAAGLRFAMQASLFTTSSSCVKAALDVSKQWNGFSFADPTTRAGLHERCSRILSCAAGPTELWHLAHAFAHFVDALAGTSLLRGDAASDVERVLKKQLHTVTSPQPSASPRPVGDSATSPSLRSFISSGAALPAASLQHDPAGSECPAPVGSTTEQPDSSVDDYDSIPAGATATFDEDDTILLTPLSPPSPSVPPSSTSPLIQPWHRESAFPSPLKSEQLVVEQLSKMKLDGQLVSPLAEFPCVRNALARGVQFTDEARGLFATTSMLDRDTFVHPQKCDAATFPLLLRDLQRRACYRTPRLVDDTVVMQSAWRCFDVACNRYHTWPTGEFTELFAQLCTQTNNIEQLTPLTAQLRQLRAEVSFESACALVATYAHFMMHEHAMSLWEQLCSRADQLSPRFRSCHSALAAATAQLAHAFIKQSRPSDIIKPLVDQPLWTRLLKHGVSQQLTHDPASTRLRLQSVVSRDWADVLVHLVEELGNQGELLQVMTIYRDLRRLPVADGPTGIADVLIAIVRTLCSVGLTTLATAVAHDCEYCFKGLETQRVQVLQQLHVALLHGRTIDLQQAGKLLQEHEKSKNSSSLRVGSHSSSYAAKALFCLRSLVGGGCFELAWFHFRKASWWRDEPRMHLLHFRLGGTPPAIFNGWRALLCSLVQLMLRVHQQHVASELLYAADYVMAVAERTGAVSGALQSAHVQLLLRHHELSRAMKVFQAQWQAGGQTMPLYHESMEAALAAHDLDASFTTLELDSVLLHLFCYLTAVPDTQHQSDQGAPDASKAASRCAAEDNVAMGATELQKAEQRSTLFAHVYRAMATLGFGASRWVKWHRCELLNQRFERFTQVIAVPQAPLDSLKQYVKQAWSSLTTAFSAEELVDAWSVHLLVLLLVDVPVLAKACVGVDDSDAPSDSARALLRLINLMGKHLSVIEHLLAQSVRFDLAKAWMINDADHWRWTAIEESFTSNLSLLLELEFDDVSAAIERVLSQCDAIKKNCVAFSKETSREDSRRTSTSSSSDSRSGDGDEEPQCWKEAPITALASELGLEVVIANDLVDLDAGARAMKGEGGFNLVTLWGWQPAGAYASMLAHRLSSQAVSWEQDLSAASAAGNTSDVRFPVAKVQLKRTSAARFVSNVKQLVNLQTIVDKEIRCGRSTNSENCGIVKLVALCCIPGEYSYITNYCAHRSLLAFLENGAHELTVETKLLLSGGIICAVVFLHRNSVFHGDVKPENVLVTADLQVRVCDFDDSRVLDGVTIELGEAGGGTFLYRPPEQWLASGKHGINVNKADMFPCALPADVFALALTLMELLASSRWRVHAGRSRSEVRELCKSAILDSCNKDTLLASETFGVNWEQLGIDEQFPQLARLLRSALSVNPAARPSVFQLQAALNEDARTHCQTGRVAPSVLRRITREQPVERTVDSGLARLGATHVSTSASRAPLTPFLADDATDDEATVPLTRDAVQPRGLIEPTLPCADLPEAGEMEEKIENAFEVDNVHLPTFGVDLLDRVVSPHPHSSPAAGQQRLTHSMSLPTQLFAHHEHPPLPPMRGESASPLMQPQHRYRSRSVSSVDEQGALYPPSTTCYHAKKCSRRDCMFRHEAVRWNIQALGLALGLELPLPGKRLDSFLVEEPDTDRRFDNVPAPPSSLLHSFPTANSSCATPARPELLSPPSRFESDRTPTHSTSCLELGQSGCLASADRAAPL